MGSPSGIAVHPEVHFTVVDGRLVVDGPAWIIDEPRVQAVIAEHTELLKAHARGVETGHAIAPCTMCDGAVLVHVDYPEDKYPRCRVRPGCKGRHVPAAHAIAERANAARRPRGTGPPRRPDNRRLFGPWPTYPPHPSWGHVEEVTR